MTAKDFAAHLRRIGACEEAYRWARGKTGATVWTTCKRGDWLLWLAARAGVRRQDVVLAACACARLSLKHVRAGEDRPRIAIETAERWARGDESVSLADVRAAAAAAYASAADYAYASAAAVADADASADAAAAAAYASAAAYAYASAADASASAAAYAAVAAAAYARTRALAECANLVRERITWAQIVAALGASTEAQP